MPQLNLHGSVKFEIILMKKRPVIGFISAPAWFDPAPSEFPEVIVEDVQTQQAPLLLPEFDYQLARIASVQKELNLCARSLKAMGCDLAAQVGSPFAWACAKSEMEARSRNRSMSKAADIPCLMTGLAIVAGLRALGVNKVAANCTYYEKDWRDGFSFFLGICGFDVLHISTLSDQGLADPSAKMEDYGWSMTPELTRASILSVAKASPDAEAVVVTGAGTRTLELLCELEAHIKRPIIAADTILYWSIANTLRLTLKPIMGSLSKITLI
jgi:maleate cis-trans isomerase